MEQPWIVDVIRTGVSAGSGVEPLVVPRVATRLSRRDVMGGLRVKWNIGRDRYAVPAGLYAVGAPRDDSPVLVSANYKLSFDVLRSSLEGIDAWILVLDTRGVNVWCAAGKGTFGTRELLRRIESTALDRVVGHRTLIVPQLGATGVSAPEVKAAGWTVKWGPVRASDIPAYLAAGQRKDDAMREVRFLLPDRMAVAPVELTQAWPIALGLAVAAVLFSMPFAPGYGGRLLAALVALLGTVAVAIFAFPALLPWLPFRAFALKGGVLGLIWGALCALVSGASLATGVGLSLVAGAVTAFIAMNFTGSSTYTSQTGAAAEVRRGILPMAASLTAGAGLCVASRVLGL